MKFKIYLELIPPLEVVTEQNEKCLIIACGESFKQETLKILRNGEEEFWIKSSINRDVLQPFIDKYTECCI